MALTIGGVTFNIDADTSGLQKSLAKLKSFGKAIGKVATSQTKGAKAIASAMTKNETLLKRSAKAAAQMQVALQKIGGEDKKIKEVANAFTKLTNSLATGKKSTRDAAVAMDRFKVTMDSASMSVKKFQGAADKTKKEAGKLTETFRNLESASVLAVGPLSGLGARIRSLGAIFSRGALQAALFFGGLAAGAIAVTKLTKAAVTSAVAWEQSMARFEAATGSLGLASKNMLFVIDVSQELGLKITDTTKAFSRLTAAAQGTALQGDKVREIFRSVASAGAALRLSSVEIEAIFRAIEQMMSKGTVQAEELRNQLGERLPGAFRLAAEAMGVMTPELNKLLRDGKVLSDDFLPKLAVTLNKAFGEKAKDNLKSFGGSLNTLHNAWFLFTKDVDRMSGASETAAKGMRTLAGTIDTLRINMGQIVRILGALAGGLAGLATGMLLLTGASAIAAIFNWSRAILSGATAINLLSKAWAAFPAGKVVAVFAKLASMAIGATIAYKMLEGITNDIAGAMDQLEKDAAGASDAINGLADPAMASDFKKFNRELDLMVMRLKFLKNTKTEDVFNRIIEPIIRFKQALEDSNVSLQVQELLLIRFKQLIQATAEAEDAFSDQAQRSADAITNGFEDLIFAGENAKDIIKDVIKELIKLAFRAAIFDPLSKSLGSFFGGALPSLGTVSFTGGTSAGFLDPGSRVFTGADVTGNAAGGPVTGGASILVGEKGPEIFTPRVHGRILTNSQSNGAGGGGLNITINAPGADAGTIARIQQMIAEDFAPAIITQATRHTLTQMQRPKFA